MYKDLNRHINTEWSDMDHQKQNHKNAKNKVKEERQKETTEGKKDNQQRKHLI